MAQIRLNFNFNLNKSIFLLVVIICWIKLTQNLAIQISHYMLL